MQKSRQIQYLNTTLAIQNYFLKKKRQNALKYICKTNKFWPRAADFHRTAQPSRHSAASVCALRTTVLFYREPQNRPFPIALPLRRSPSRQNAKRQRRITWNVHAVSVFALRMQLFCGLSLLTTLMPLLRDAVKQFLNPLVLSYKPGVDPWYAMLRS